MAPAEQYPPRRHVHRDLRLALEHAADGSGRAWLPVTTEVLTEGGGVRAGVLAVLVDVLAAGLALRAVSPDWVATADLTLHLTGAPLGDAGGTEKDHGEAGEIEARARVLRRGRTTVVCEVEVLDASGSPAGIGTMTFAVLARRDGNPAAGTPPGGFPRVSLAVDGSGLRGPVLDELGITVTDAASGEVRVPLADFVRNSLGSLQGGVLATLACVSAEEAIGAACGTRVDAVDLHVTYLAAAREGPAHATAEVLAAESDWGCARVDVLDGPGGRLAAIARVTAAATSPCADPVRT